MGRRPCFVLNLTLGKCEVHGRDTAEVSGAANWLRITHMRQTVRAFGTPLGTMAIVNPELPQGLRG